MRRKTIKDVIAYLAECHPGSQVVNTQYINNKTKLEFVCEKGHQFSAKFNSIVDSGTWCKRCSGKNLLSLRDLIDHVNKYHPGARVLDTQYANRRSKMNFICEKGHTFTTMVSNVFNNHNWCPKCGRDNAKATCIEKYGVDNPSRVESISLKKKATFLKNYGVDHPSKNKDVALRIAKSTNHSAIRYHWKTSEELVCVGSYESKTVDYLNKNKIDFQWQPRVFQLKETTYRPDLYFSDRDLWVEIKGYFRDDAKAKWDEFCLQQTNSELWDKIKLKSIGIL